MAERITAEQFNIRDDGIPDIMTRSLKIISHPRCEQFHKECICSRLSSGRGDTWMFTSTTQLRHSPTLVCVTESSAVYQGLFCKSVAVLRSSAYLGCRGEGHAHCRTGSHRVDICHMFVYREQGSTTGERDALQRETEPTLLDLKGGVQLCCCIIQTCTYRVGWRTKKHTRTRTLTHIPAVRRASVISQ